MEGTKEIDELMRPVGAAIRRHIKRPDAFTDIYNRAYEAIMVSMDAKDSLRAEIEHDKSDRPGAGSHRRPRRGGSLANIRQTFENGMGFYRDGKTAAGRLLDGHEYSEYPEVR